MRVARIWFVIILGSALVTASCDRLEAIKDQLLGTSASTEEENPQLEAIRNLYEAGRYDSALQSIQTLIQEDPTSAEAFYYRGLCHLAKAGEVSDPSEPMTPEETAGLEAFERALSINPRHAPSAIGIGDLYSRRVPARRRRATSEGDPEDPYSLALAAYERAVTIDPKLPEAQSHYARFLERTGRLEEAENAHRAAAEAAATVPEIAPDYYIAYGRFLAGPVDRLDEALEQFELAQMFRQDDPTIQREMAIVHARIGERHFEKQEYLLAEAALTKAYDLFPDKGIEEAQETANTLEQLRSIRRR